MAEHLLGPLGVGGIPADISGAIAAYLPARSQAEGRLHVRVSRDIEDEVVPRLREAGLAVP